eukprot:scaffold43611_cov71-Attheya_sp.AAC.1
MMYVNGILEADLIEDNQFQNECFHGTHSMGFSFSGASGLIALLASSRPCASSNLSRESSRI